MTEALLDIKHWDNSLGVQLPAKVVCAAHLQLEQREWVHAEDGRAVIESVCMCSCHWYNGWPALMQPPLRRSDGLRFAGG